MGNRTTETSPSGITNYSYQSNKLTSSAGAKTFNFSYDNNGNTIAESSSLNANRSYIYNQNQRLIKAVENGTTLGEYLYNANGQRVKKVANGRITYFIYDQMGNLIEEADENGQVNSDYIYLGSIPVARVDEWWEGMPTPQAPTGLNVVPSDKQLTVFWASSPPPVDGYKVYWGTESKKYTSSKDVGKVTSYTITGLTNGTTYYVSVTAYADIKEPYYYHTDHLGTPILMTDKNQQIVWQGEFLPYGEAYSITGTVTNNLRFPGQYADKETGLHQNYFRDFHPPSGTYRQKDPIGFLGGINLYSYGNNPVNKTDPSGLSAAAIPLLEACLANPRACGGAILSGGAAIFTAIKNIVQEIPRLCRDDDSPCPPCKTVSGKIVPVGTIAYRPLDIPPLGVVEHGISGPHYNIYKANQAPKNSPQPCKCFWQPIGAVLPSNLPHGAIVIEPFAD